MSGYPAQPYPAQPYPPQGYQGAPQGQPYGAPPPAYPGPPYAGQPPPGQFYGAPGGQAPPPGHAPQGFHPPQQQLYAGPPGNFPPQQVLPYGGPPPAQGPPAGYQAGPSQQPHLMGQAAALGGFHDPTGKYKIVMQGAFVAVEASISPTEKVKSEAGAMAAMSSNVDIIASLDGGVGAAFCRSCCAGESAFFSTYHLKEGTRGDVLLAPAMPGEIILIHMNGQQDWRIQKGSYLASDESISIGTAMQGLAQGCCSGEGFFILSATGAGRLLLNSYGGIVRYDLAPGEVRKIDNGFLVAWTSNMNYTINLATKSLVASFVSGEAIITTFTGPGTVYVQTRSVTKLAQVVAPYIPIQSQHSGGDGGGGDGGGGN